MTQKKSHKNYKHFCSCGEQAFKKCDWCGSYVCSSCSQETLLKTGYERILCFDCKTELSEEIDGRE